MKPSRKLEKAHTTLALEHCNTGLQLDKAKARIAELTAEVASLREALRETYKFVPEYIRGDLNIADIARNALGPATSHDHDEHGRCMCGAYPGDEKSINPCSRNALKEVV